MVTLVQCCLRQMECIWPKPLSVHLIRVSDDLSGDLRSREFFMCEKLGGKVVGELFYHSALAILYISLKALQAKP